MLDTFKPIRRAFTIQKSTGSGEPENMCKDNMHIEMFFVYRQLQSGSATHVRLRTAWFYILLWCVSPRFPGDTPLCDILWCITLVPNYSATPNSVILPHISPDLESFVILSP